MCCHREEQQTHREDDDVVDQRECRRSAEIEFAQGNLDEIDRDEGCRITGTTTAYHEGFGGDHEDVHEAQQDVDHQHAPQLRQFDIAEDREARGAIDPCCL